MSTGYQILKVFRKAYFNDKIIFFKLGIFLPKLLRYSVTLLNSKSRHFTFHLYIKRGWKKIDNEKIDLKLHHLHIQNSSYTCIRKKLLTEKTFHSRT